MTHWGQVKEVFAEAVEREGPEREAYLRESCGPDAELRAEVDRLLAGHEADDDLLDNPALSAKWLSAPEPEEHVFAVGETLAGRFEIVRFIGRGGMGEVYEAKDLELGGHVAIKTLLREFTADPTGLRRFKREIQLARKVTHPNVCRIFDVARHERDGREHTFLSMELLEGETLSGYLKSKGKLSTDEALSLVRQMAAGLDALHRAGIVHRDFKPANVILTEESGGGQRAVITDFGLARPAVDEGRIDTRVSFSGQVLGTPDYMAPEQLSGRPLSPATDVYSLGLVMYEMVTGAKPFREGQALETAVQRITETPVPAKQHVPDLPEPWDATILHCLEKAPEDRPVSAGEITKVLEASGEVPVARARRHSDARRVTVRPPVQRTLNPHIWRWRWLALAASVAVLVALFAWTIRDRWTTGSNGEKERLHVAVLPFSVPGDNPELRAFADGLMESLTSGLSQYEGLNKNLLVVPASEVRRRRVATAADALSRFNANYVVKSNLETQGERVRLQLVLIDTEQMRQLETARVEESRSKALNLQDGALARLGNLLDLAVRPEHASDQPSLAPGAHEFYLQGLGYLQRSHKTDNIHVAISLFERALELDGGYALGYAGLAEAYLRLYGRTNDPKWVESALSNSERALELNKQLPKVLVTAGRVYSATGRYDEALAAFSDALDGDSRDGEAFEGLARTYTLMERYSDAVATHQKAIMLRPGDWRTHSNLALFYFRRNEFHKAIESFRRVVALTPDSSLAHSNLAVALHRVGQIEESRAMYERSIEIEPSARALSNLGALLSSLGQRKDALPLYERAVEIDEGDHGLWANLGSAYDALGDSRAQRAFLRAAAIVEEMLTVNPERGDLHSTLAHYYAGGREFSRAERSLKEAEQRQSPSPGELADNAATCAKLGLLDRALIWAERALESGYPAEDLAKRRWMAPLVGDPRFQALLSQVSG